VLFLLYINDLESCIEYGRPTFFADDTSIFISAKSVNRVQGKVNVTINKLTEWFNRNKLIINQEKTTAILFHQPQKVHFEFPLIKLDDSVINYLDHLQFLEVWLDNNLNWSIHTRDIAKKLSKICFGLRVVRRATGLETVCIIYYAYFQSMLSYGLIL
jgi:ribosomal protein L31E